MNPQAVPATDPDLRSLRELASRLPRTVQPSVVQQLNEWEMLFPFERNRLVHFLNSVASLPPAELDRITTHLRSVEDKMGVARWNFSASSNTMENSGQLARSQNYAEWRRAVQEFFAAVDAGAPPDPATLERHSLVVLVLPQCLPATAQTAWAPWGTEGTRIEVRGDASSICDLLVGQFVRQSHGQLLAEHVGSDPSDAWFIDAASGAIPEPESSDAICCLRWSVLDSFRAAFLSEMNSIPRDTHIASETLTLMRQKDWSYDWPAELRNQDRLRNFVVDLYLSGNGALIFPNAFVEWTAAEAFRRARPRVLIARFGMRNKPKPFTSIAIFENQSRVSSVPDVPDPENSAVDAAMLARYVWLAAHRYQDYDRALCLCVVERLNEIRVIAPAGSSLAGTSGPLSPAEVCAAARSWLAS